MATIKDIAKLAGVSHGTVSNVMNHKGNVSTDKIRLVENAARALGYNTNVQAQRLRKENSRHVALIVPDINHVAYCLFTRHLLALLEGSDYGTSLHFSENASEKERECIQAALSNQPECIVAFSCLEEPAAQYPTAVPVVFVNHPFVSPHKSQISITFDYEEAARQIVQKAVEKQAVSTAVYLDSDVVSADRALYEALKIEFAQKHIRLAAFNYDSRLLYNGVIAILENEPSFDLVITTTVTRAEKLRQVHHLLGCPLPDIITLAPAETVPAQDFTCYEFDYRHLSQSVFQLIQDRKPHLGKRIIAPAKGFRSDTSCGPAVLPQREVTLLTITSPTADILRSLAPYFHRCTGIQLKIVALPYEELFSMLSSGLATSYDLVRMDMVWRSMFERELCIPLAGMVDRLEPVVRSFLPSIRSVYCPDIKSAYTLPFDPSVQMLFYRKDLFENAMIKRQFYEKTKKQLEAPSSFEAFDRVAAFFSARFNPDSATEYGATMTYGAAAVAACDILPRIKSMGGGVFDEAGHIRVDTPIYRKALEEYLALRDCCSPDVNYWWGAAMETLTAGQTAMVVVFINHASRIINAQNAGTFSKLGAAPVPGNCQLLGGGCIGISKNSKNTALGAEFLDWVYSDETANMIALLGGLSPCASVFGNEEILELYPWLRNISGDFQRGWRTSENERYPTMHQHLFERILGIAVRNAAMGILSVDEALRNAQSQCDKEFVPNV